jgi:superfamily II RNA helicase
VRERQDAFLLLLNKHVQMLGCLNCIRDGVIALTGRVALEMTTAANELICAELIVRNFFNDLPPDEAAALISCLVLEKGSKDQVAAPEAFSEKVDEIRDVARDIAQQLRECEIEHDEKEWVDSHVNPAGIEATLEWVRGGDFQTCLELGSLTEGQLVRLLISTATQLACFAKAAMLVGNKGLAETFEETSTGMKRGIIFTASLYLD